MPTVTELIQEEIARHEVISFARFMTLALYTPVVGYYEQPAAGPGRAGDFYTSVSVGSFFGELLAFEFSGWLAERPVPCQIVEAGAHDGRLAADILGWLDRHRPGLAAGLEYWIIEPSPTRRAWQEAGLAPWAGRVRWWTDWSELPAEGVSGVIFSNELMDAFPVHRLVWSADAGAWAEWGVGWLEDRFVWRPMAAATPGVPHPVLPPELQAVLPDGFTTEVCPTAPEWWSRAAHALRAGRLLTLDYGLTREEFFTPGRARGTARAYYHHRLVTDLLDRPGDQDLTAQVDFSALREAGEAAGLRTTEWQTQAQFLTGILRHILTGEKSFPRWTAAHNRQFQALTHPEHLGRAFRVLGQSRP